MVIIGSILALAGSLFPLFLRYAVFSGFAPVDIPLMLTAILAFTALFRRCSPSLGVMITLLSMYEIARNYFGPVVAGFLFVSTIGGFMITLKAHDNWIEKKEAHWNGLD